MYNSAVYSGTANCGSVLFTVRYLKHQQTESAYHQHLTTHLLCACFEMEEDYAVAAWIRYQVLLDEVYIALHVRLESKQVSMA